MVILFLEQNGLTKLNTIEELNKMGVTVLIATENKSICRMEGVKDFIYTEFHNMDKLISDITYYVDSRAEKVDFIVTYTEFLVETVALLNEYFGTKGLSYAAAKIARNKYLTKYVVNQDECCRRFVPDFELLVDCDDVKKLNFHKNSSYILKPVNCSASYGVYKVTNENEAKKALLDFKKCENEELTKRLNEKANLNYIVAERYVDGFEISVESITINGTTMNYLIHDKISPVEPPFFLEECCTSYSSRISMELKLKIYDITSKILGCIGFDNGISHVEYRIENGEPYLIEINSRPGGGLIVESVFFATGINLISEYIRGLITGNLSKPLCNNISINRSIFPNVGKVSSVSGIEQIDYRNPVIKLVKNTCSYGEVVTTPETSGNVEILLAGNDFEELITVMHDLEEKITIEVE